jgi:hypothetical protein
MGFRLRTYGPNGKPQRWQMTRRVMEPEKATRAGPAGSLDQVRQGDMGGFNKVSAAVVGMLVLFS